MNLAKWLFVTPADPCHVGVQLWSKSGRKLGLCQEVALDPKREHGSSGIPKPPKRDSDMRDCPTEGSRLNEGSGIVLWQSTRPRIDTNGSEYYATCLYHAFIEVSTMLEYI